MTVRALDYVFRPGNPLTDRLFAAAWLGVRGCAEPLVVRVPQPLWSAANSDEEVPPMKVLRVQALLLRAPSPRASAEAQEFHPRAAADDGRGRATPGYERPPPKQDKRFPIGRLLDGGVSLNGKPFSGASGRPSSSTSSSARTGFGGCNTFAATAYPLRQQKFAVGPFALPTPKSCEKAMAIGDSFLVALRTAVEWDSSSSAPSSSRPRTASCASSARSEERLGRAATRPPPAPARRSGRTGRRRSGACRCAGRGRPTSVERCPIETTVVSGRRSISMR